jgi:hypothetical protein
MLADLPFHLQLILEVIDIVVLGGIILLITRWFDNRKASRELRRQTISRMVEVAYPLYMHLQEHFSFIEYGSNSLEGSFELSAEQTEALDKAFAKFRTEAAIVQNDLEVYFRRNRQKFEMYVNHSDQGRATNQPPFCDAREPWTIWHSVKDLLQVDYFLLTKPTHQCQIYANNVAYHIGLELEISTGTDAERIANHHRIKRAFERQLLVTSKSVESTDSLANRISRRWDDRKGFVLTMHQTSSPLVLGVPKCVGVTSTHVVTSWTLSDDPDARWANTFKIRPAGSVLTAAPPVIECSRIVWEVPVDRQEEANLELILRCEAANKAIVDRGPV